MSDVDREYGVFSSGATFYPEHMTVAHGMALLTNNTGGSVQTGGVYVINTSAAKSFVSTTTAGDTRRVVIIPQAIGAGGAGTKTIANGQAGFVYLCTGQYVPVVNVEASVSVGEYLITSSTAGFARGSRVYVNNSPPPNGAFAIALTSGSGQVAAITLPQVAPHFYEGGRLSVSSTEPVILPDYSASGVTEYPTLHYVPYTNNLLTLWSSGAWATFRFSTLSLSVSGLTAGYNYDIFAYVSSGVPALTAVQWTNDTTRATSISRLHGRFVDSSNRLYLGTIRVSLSGSNSRLLLGRSSIPIWNAYNRLPVYAYSTDSTTHSYTTSAWRRWNNSDATKIEVVYGLNEQPLGIQMHGRISAGGSAAQLGVGLDTTSSNSLDGSFRTSGDSVGGLIGAKTASAGYHYLHIVENGATSATFNYAAMRVDLMW